MPGYGDFYNKKQKKLSKEEQAKRAAKAASPSFWTPLQPVVLGKGKKSRQGAGGSW